MLENPRGTALVALVLVAALGGGMPGIGDKWLVSPAFAQDDDDGGGDDDDDVRPRAGAPAAPAPAPAPAPTRPRTVGASPALPAAPAPRATPAEPAAPVAPIAPRASAPPPPFAVAGEVLVSGLSDNDLAALMDEGFVVIETTVLVQSGPTLIRLAVPEGLSPEAARDRVRARPSGRNADLNHYFRTGQGILPASAPNDDPQGATADCGHLNCAALAQIAWPADRPETCRATVDIGVIDTGVNLAHAGLTAARVDLIRLTRDALPPSGDTHGTAVVSLLVGAEARAPGLLPEGRVVAIDIFSRRQGDERAEVAHLIRALDLLSQRGIRVANLSLAGPENTVLSDMLAAVTAKGMLVVAAAGNAGPAAPPAWPAAADTALAVTAVDANDRIYRRAQRGDHLDLAAPGVEVWSAAAIKGVKPRTGTSYAVPFVTAAAVILMSRDPALTPAATIDTLRRLTRDLGAAGTDGVYGAGVLNVANLCDGP